MAALLLLLVGWPLSVVADEQTDRRVVRLIRQLGVQQFKKREAACRALEALGERALPELRRAIAAKQTLERARRLRSVYWRILVSKPLAQKLRLDRNRLIPQLMAGGANQQAALKKLLSGRKLPPRMLGLVSELLRSSHRQLGARGSGKLLGQLSGPSQKRLLKRLLPVLLAYPAEIRRVHCELAYRDFPQQAHKLVAVALRSTSFDPLRQSNIIDTFIDHEAEPGWLLLLELSRRPGPHRIGMARHLYSIQTRWHQRHRQVLPGLVDEVARQARRGEDASLPTDALAQMRNTGPSGWNKLLIELISDKRTSAWSRARLVQALDIKQEIPQAERLLPLLAEDNWATHRRIASYFSRVPLKAALPALRALYRRNLEPRGYPAKELTRCLGQSGTAADHALLRRAAIQPKLHTLCREQALAALGQRHRPESLAFLQRLYLERRDKLRRGERWHLIDALLRHAAKLPISLLQRLVGEGRDELRQRAIKALADRSGAEVDRVLSALLDSRHADVLRAVAIRLARDGKQAAVAKQLLRRLEASRSAERKCGYLAALGALRSRSAINALEGLLKDRSAAVREAAFQALIATTPRIKQSVLLQLIDDPSKSVRKRVLAQIQRQPSPPLAHRLLVTPIYWKQRQLAWRRAVSMGFAQRAVIEVTRYCLNHAVSDEHAWLVELFDSYGKQHRRALLQLLLPYRADSKVGPLATELLAMLGEPAAFRQVLHWLEDPRRRAAALRALSINRDERAMVPLVRLLDSSDKRLSRKVLSVLACTLKGYRYACIGPVELEVKRWRGYVRDKQLRRVDWFRQVLQTGSLAEVEPWIIRAIARFGYKELTPELLRRLDKIGAAGERTSIVWTLGELGDPLALDRLKSLVGDPDPQLSVAALEAVARSGQSSALPGLALWLERRMGQRGIRGYREANQAFRIARLLARKGHRLGFQALLAWKNGNPVARYWFWSYDGEALLAKLSGEPRWTADWWQRNLQRFKPIEQEPHPVVDRLLALLRSKRGLLREQASERLLGCGKLPRPQLIELLLGPDRRLRDLVAELLLRSQARWAAPFLLTALREGSALPALPKIEMAVQESFQVRWPLDKRGRAALRSVSVQLELLSAYWDSLTESLLVLAGKQSVAALVSLSRNRSHFYRYQLLLRFRRVFGLKLVKRLPLEPEVVRRQLARWAAWAGSERLAATRELELSKELVRRKALRIRWPALAAQDRAAWQRRSIAKVWLRPLLIALSEQYPDSIRTKQLPSWLRVEVEQRWRAQLEYARQVGRLAHAQRWAKRLRSLGTLTAVSWRRIAALASAQSRWQSCVTAWDGYLKLRRNDELGYYERALALYELRAFERATRDLAHALARLGPGTRRQRAVALRALCFDRLRRWKEADRDYRAWETHGESPDRARYLRIRLAWRCDRPAQVLALAALGSGAPRLEWTELEMVQLYQVCALVRLERLDEARTLLRTADKKWRNWQHDPRTSSDPARIAEGVGLLELGWALYLGARGKQELALHKLRDAIKAKAVSPQAAARLPEFRQWADTPAFRALTGRIR